MLHVRFFKWHRRRYQRPAKVWTHKLARAIQPLTLSSFRGWLWISRAFRKARASAAGQLELATCVLFFLIVYAALTVCFSVCIYMCTQTSLGGQKQLGTNFRHACYSPRTAVTSKHMLLFSYRSSNHSRTTHVANTYCWNSGKQPLKAHSFRRLHAVDDFRWRRRAAPVLRRSWRFVSARASTREDVLFGWPGSLIFFSGGFEVWVLSWTKDGLGD